ncbi:hypothetical protein [Thalassococcus lentus]|uniref:Uncharacterized protein n=1 Tax=Thalassococcus lentus TaxID=1210524 RepID=A0ABT4XMW3_9RHOB|nr:hypothetical protein [Thalassococcus lentus]MDA7423270.1 hypothetical protein [Thalassococcus lentus]
MQNPNAIKDTQFLNARYEAAKAELVKSQKLEQGQSGALVFAALAYGDALEESKMFKLVSHWAMLFCIAAAFVIPNLLVVRVLL